MSFWNTSVFFVDSYIIGPNLYKSPIVLIAFFNFVASLSCDGMQLYQTKGLENALNFDMLWGTYNCNFSFCYTGQKIPSSDIKSQGRREQQRKANIAAFMRQLRALDKKTEAGKGIHQVKVELDLTGEEIVEVIAIE